MMVLLKNEYSFSGGDTQILLAVKIALCLLYSFSGGGDAKTRPHARVLALSPTTTASYPLRAMLMKRSLPNIALFDSFSNFNMQQIFLPYTNIWQRNTSFTSNPLPVSTCLIYKFDDNLLKTMDEAVRTKICNLIWDHHRNFFELKLQ